MRERLRALALVLVAALACACGGGGEPTEQGADLVLVGGRVMDPESGLDAVRNVALRAGRIAEISEGPLDGGEVIDVSGMVVAPGFIDLHSHGQDPRSVEFRARDGATTALDLELGAYPVEQFLEFHAGRSLLHYGASVGHIPARVYLKHGLRLGHMPTIEVASGLRAWGNRQAFRYLAPTAYAIEPSTRKEVEELLGFLAEGLAEGGIGVGLGFAYTPGVQPSEFLEVFELAGRSGVSCFVHLQSQLVPNDTGPIERALGLARSTGAGLHVAHVTSSAVAQTPEYLARIDRAREEGVRVTAEVYPYNATVVPIESPIFRPGWRQRNRIDYGDLEWLATGERLTEETFLSYREQGGPVIVHMMKPELVEPALLHPAVIVASDGLPMAVGNEHPRGAGSFARLLGYYVRERQLMPLMEALAKITLAPAQRVEDFVPAMRDKGRIRVGADADVTVFDPERVLDRATFEAPHQFSEGIAHVIVAGVPVVRDGELVKGVFPGRAIRSEVGPAASE